MQKKKPDTRTDEELISVANSFTGFHPDTVHEAQQELVRRGISSASEKEKLDQWEEEWQQETGFDITEPTISTETGHNEQVDVRKARSLLSVGNNRHLPRHPATFEPPMEKREIG